MAVVAVFEFPNADIAQYHKAFEVGGAQILEQPDRLQHVCFRTESGFTVIDVWRDAASFQKFGEVIGPVTAEVGLDAQPQMYEAVGTISQSGERTTF